MVCHETFQNKNGAWVYPDEVIEKDGNLIHINSGEKILKGPSESMSKSKKNVIDPENIINDYGADAARWFMLSDSPPERDIIWSLSGIQGSWRFIQKVWSLIQKHKHVFDSSANHKNAKKNTNNQELLKKIHTNLNDITNSIEKFQMNVSIAKIYEIVNEVTKFSPKEEDCLAIKESLEILIRVIEPMTPHLAEECWLETGHINNLTHEPWPEANKDFLIQKTAVVIIQINGKKRGELTVMIDTSEEDVLKGAMEIKNINSFLEKKKILKTVYIPNKILNIVI
jgi:leucyl-tRNA synthetase